MKKILAWHFCKEVDGRPVLRDGSPLARKTYSHDGPLEMCRSGLHASRRISDALSFSPGNWISRVECWSGVEEQSDKLICRNRRVLWYYDAGKSLHRAACDVAEHAMLRHGNDDARSWEAIKCKRRWLLSNASDLELAAARDVAWAAALDAAGDAAGDAAWDVAWDAARDAAGDAARAAAWAAARDVAGAAAWAAARDVAGAAAWDVAWAAALDAAGDAAGDAARDAAGDEWEEILLYRILSGRK